MTGQTFWMMYGEAAKTAVGFFWKAGWAFVLGYFVSAMIQAFVPKAKLTRYMGSADLSSVSLATIFGAASSSCSFAALGAARSLVLKGAHFIAAVAFMFASTNLVIELGILILIFLGSEYLIAELVGGLMMIVISSLLMRLTYPQKWVDAARERLEAESPPEEDDFDWRARIKSGEGWHMVGRKFVADWQMVWEEILIGFTIAGFVAVLVPASFWSAVFLGADTGLPQWLVAVENAAVAPFVAAMTFIGSMGNIPLATVLSANGVLFAGIMGFIYSDLIVPPLVRINARYYGWPVSLYIAAVMYVSIVLTGTLIHTGFALLDAVPQSGREIAEVAQFKFDYTFWLNLAFIAHAVWLVWLARSGRENHHSGHGGHAGDGGHAGHDHGGGGFSLKRIVALGAMALLAVGLIAFAVTGGRA